MKQESIPIGCVPPAWKPYILHFQWLPPDVTRGVPSSDAQEEEGVRSPDLMSREGTQPDLSWGQGGYPTM